MSPSLEDRAAPHGLDDLEHGWRSTREQEQRRQDISTHTRKVTGLNCTTSPDMNTRFDLPATRSRAVSFFPPLSKLFSKLLLTGTEHDEEEEAEHHRVDGVLVLALLHVPGRNTGQSSMNLRRLRIDEGSDDNVQHLPLRSRSGRCPSCRCSSRTSRSGGGSGGWSVKGPEQRADGEMPFLGQRQTPTLRATHHGLKIEKDWTKPNRVMPAGKHIGFTEDESGMHCLLASSRPDY